MKKYLIISLIIAITLMGCSQKKTSNPTESSDTLSQKEIFAKFMDEEDLRSYVLKGNAKGIISLESGQKEESNIFKIEDVREVIKKPKVYHIKSQDIDDNGKNETEEYVFDKVRFYRDDSGEWQKDLFEEKVKKYQEEKAYFTPQRTISSTTILKPLESYYELTEVEDMYIAKLESTPDNINEIRNILFDHPGDSPFFEELTSLKAEFLFKKDNYYPISYEWEAKFLTKDNKEVTKLKYSGVYDKVNEFKSIEIPQEIKAQLK